MIPQLCFPTEKKKEREIFARAENTLMNFLCPSCLNPQAVPQQWSSRAVWPLASRAESETPVQKSQFPILENGEGSQAIYRHPPRRPPHASSRKH